MNQELRSFLPSKYISDHLPTPTSLPLPKSKQTSLHLDTVRASFVTLHLCSATTAFFKKYNSGHLPPHPCLKSFCGFSYISHETQIPYYDWQSSAFLSKLTSPLCLFHPFCSTSLKTLEYALPLVLRPLSMLDFLPERITFQLFIWLHPFHPSDSSLNNALVDASFHSPSYFDFVSIIEYCDILSIPTISSHHIFFLLNVCLFCCSLNLKHDRSLLFCSFYPECLAQNSHSP